MELVLKLEGVDKINSVLDKLSAQLDAVGAKVDAVSLKFKTLNDSVHSVTHQLVMMNYVGGGAIQSMTRDVQSLVQKCAMVNKMATAAGSGAGASGAIPQSGWVNTAGYNYGGAVPPVSNSANAAAGAPIAARSVQTGIPALSKFLPVVNAVAAMAEALKFAGQRAGEYSDLTFRGKSGEGAARSVAGLGTAAGVDLSDVANDAASRPGGAAQLANQLRTLRNIDNDQAAARYAEMTGTSRYMNVRRNRMDDETFNNALDPTRHGIDSTRANAAARSMAKLNEVLTSLADKAANLLLPTLTKVLDLLSWLGEFVNKNWSWMKAFFGPVVNYYDSVSPSDKAQMDAANKQQAAAQQFMDAVSNFTGFAGGGQRARGSVPSALLWYGQAQALYNDSKFLGAFSG